MGVSTTIQSAWQKQNNMADKLYKCHCRVAGHGVWCEVAQDKKKNKKEYNKFRRRLLKRDCRLLMKQAVDLWKATPLLDK